MNTCKLSCGTSTGNFFIYFTPEQQSGSASSRRIQIRAAVFNADPCGSGSETLGKKHLYIRNHSIFFKEINSKFSVSNIRKCLASV